MKRLLAVLTLAFSTSAFATPVLIGDGYVGSDDHGHGDVIGSVSKFGIDSMLVDIVGTTLTVKINTGFAVNGGLGDFTGATSTANVGAGKGIGYGDLFISSSGWSPFGPAPYSGDNHSTGTNWDYGISLTDRWDTSTGSDIGATLYSLSGTNNQSAYLSDDFLSSATFRNGQEVAVDTTATGYVTAETYAATFTPTATQLIFTLDFDGISALENATSIGLHWAMTCGNDTIEGGYPVPEPTTVIMMLLGMLCLVSAGLRRRQHGINTV